MLFIDAIQNAMERRCVMVGDVETKDPRSFTALDNSRKAMKIAARTLESGRRVVEAWRQSENLALRRTRNEMRTG